MNSSPNSEVKATRKVLSTILLLFGSFLILGTWALSSPTGSSPDDNYHLPSIWCSSLESAKECQRQNNQYLVPNQIANRNMICYIIWIDKNTSAYNKNASCIYDQKEGYTAVSYLNQIQNQYPKLGYSVSNLLVNDKIDDSVLRIRIFWSAAFIILVLWSLIEVGKATAAKIFPILALLIIPLGVFLIPSTNPSSQSIISLTALPLALFALLETTKFGIDLLRRLVLFYLLALIGAGARADAAFYVLVVSISLILIKHKSMNLMWKIFILSPSFIYSLIQLFGSRQTGFALKSGLGQSNAGIQNKLDLDVHNLINFPQFMMGFWGYNWNLGWKFEPPFPSVYSVFLALNFICLLVFIGRYTFNRRSIALIFGTTLIVTAIALYALHVSDAVVGEIVQPRYLFPLFTAGIISSQLISKPYQKREITFRMNMYIVISVGLSLTCSTMILRSMLIRVVNGRASDSLSLSPDSWWWESIPFSPSAVLGINCFGVIIFLLGLWAQQVRLRQELNGYKI